MQELDRPVEAIPHELDADARAPFEACVLVREGVIVQHPDEQRGCVVGHPVTVPVSVCGTPDDAGADPMSAATDTARPDPGGPDLTGKVAIVSGASRGIGRGLALGLAQAGAAVVCSARTTTDRPNDLGLPGTIEETVDAIRAVGGDALAVRCDIGVADDITALVDATISRYGRLDVLVNNAMAPTRGLFPETTEDMWDESMRINVRSLFLTAQAVVPPMREQGAGSIINISSGAADPYITGMPPGYVTYSVAKAALERFSTALAGELADVGVAVNALRPGAVKTEMTVHELGDDYDWTGWTAPDAVVPAVNFLAAQTGTGVTGRILESTQYATMWP